MKIREDSEGLIQKVNQIETKGWFDKTVKLDYKLLFQRPTIFFRCLEDDSYSFRIHKEGFRNYGESEFWKEIAEREELTIFNGFANRFYGAGFGTLKGYLSTINNKRTLGLYLREGVIKHLLTEEDLIFYQALTIDSIKESKGLKKKVKKIK